LFNWQAAICHQSELGMAGYLVLARKYRSRTFDEVVGQEPIARTLVNAIAVGRVAHAYLFTGTRGVGKTTMARILAKALNCLKSDGPTPTPCNQCGACVGISRGDDMDTIEIDGASNRKLEETQEVISNCIFKPSRCRYKIIYIDEVHMLTKESFNALLKTLEEPPEHVKFIFATTEVEKVPATILSRCQRFDFRNIPTPKIAEHLAKICKAEDVQAEGDALFRIARAAAGSMRDGLSLLDQIIAAGGGQVSDQEVVRLLGTPPEERMLAIARAIADGGAAAALGELNGILEGGVALSSAVAGLGDVFRNMMLATVCGAGSDLIELTESQRLAVGELAKRFSTPVLVQAVGMLQNLAYKVRSSSVARGLVEAVLVRLAEADKFVDPASLVERIEALAAGEPVGAGKRALPGVATPGRPVGEGRTPPPPGAAAPAPPSTAPGAAAQPQTLAPIQWEGAWLGSHWEAVIQHLSSRRQMRVAGMLRAAKVLAFQDGVLRMGFDPQAEVLRKQCEGAMDAAIRSALTDLAGRPIRCEYATGVQEGTPCAAVLKDLSTAEKAEIQKDPAVRAVTDLFGGAVVDVRRDLGASAVPEADET
jgi:DNA polymerase-3 subunit gamma/tau